MSEKFKGVKKFIFERGLCRRVADPKEPAERPPALLTGWQRDARGAARVLQGVQGKDGNGNELDVSLLFRAKNRRLPTDAPPPPVRRENGALRSWSGLPPSCRRDCRYLFCPIPGPGHDPKDDAHGKISALCRGVPGKCPGRDGCQRERQMN